MSALGTEHNCTHCGGPETTDKDCMCGGSGMRSVQILGLEGCIQYWRDKHLKLLIENSALKRDERHAWDYLAKACGHDPKAHDSSGFHNAVTVFGFAQHVVRERDALREQVDRHLETLRNIAVIGLGMSDPLDESTDGKDWAEQAWSEAIASLRKQRDELLEALKGVKDCVMVPWDTEAVVNQRIRELIKKVESASAPSARSEVESR